MDTFGAERIPVKQNRKDGQSDREYLVEALNAIKREMDLVYRNFDYATDPDMIDSYIYEIKSLQLRYKHFLGLCKDMGVVSGLGA